MNLTVLQWRDLAFSLDQIPQKDLPTTADVRKCVGVVDDIRDGIRKEAESYEKTFKGLQEEADKITKPAKVKITKLRGDMTDEQAEKDPDIMAISLKATKTWNLLIKR